jgi:small subunit ribosomal protein S1
MSSSKQSKSTTMADLLKSVKTNFIKVSKGEVLSGVITKLTTSEILVDIGVKTEGVVLEKDKKILRSLLSTLKVGDKVTVSVLNPESDFGNPVVSLRRFNDENVWKKMETLQKEKTPIEALVDEATRGGFLISTKDGISGFLPNSQAVFLNNAQGLVGKTINVLIIELNKNLKKVIFSQKATLSSQDFEKAVKTLKIGDKIETIISNIAPFGIFTLVTVTDEKQVEGFIHISEVAWEKTVIIPDIFKQGEKIEALILGFDKESKRINLSIKSLTKNPFAEKLKSFAVDQKVSGSVTKILSSGVLVDLGEGIEGFIKKDKIPPTLTYKEGSLVNATVVEVDEKKQKLVLVPVLTEKPIGYR